MPNAHARVKRIPHACYNSIHVSKRAYYKKGVNNYAEGVEHDGLRFTEGGSESMRDKRSQSIVVPCDGEKHRNQVVTLKLEEDPGGHFCQLCRSRCVDSLCVTNCVLFAITVTSTAG